MTHGDPTVGSVAEEAARLIGLLCGDPSGETARQAGMRAAAQSGTCPTCGRDASVGSAPVGADSSRDSNCRYCPVCHLIGFVRGISPEVIDRIADVVDLVGGGLRDLADSRRRSGAEPQPSPPSPADPPQ